MTSRAAVSYTLAAALLAIGCAPLGLSQRWDPDRPVLPLRVADGDRQKEDGGLPSSYVILLADADGTTGSIVIDRPEGRVVLDRPGMLSLDTLTPEPRATAFEPSPVFAEALEFEPRAPTGLEIYFPSDGSEPTAESRRRLEEILASLSDWPAAEVQLAGHADRFGSPQHNEELSRQRAETLRDAFLASGARAEFIEMSWYGESRPAVVTGDGVRELRNRRVEIRIR